MNPSRTESKVIESPRSRRLRLLWLFLSVLVAIPCAAQAPCNYTVTSLADSGAGSLRAGLADSTVTNICFSVTGTITLSSPLLVLYPVTITDPGGVTISGNNQVGILVIGTSSPTDAVRFNGFTLTNGNATAGNNIWGGAVWVQQGNVTFVGTIMTNNTATGGGAVYNSGTLTLSGCGIRNNTATTNGGGIVNTAGASLTLQGSDVSTNSAVSGNGGGLDNYGTTQVQGSFFTHDQASNGGGIDNESGGQLPISGGTTFSYNTASVDGGALINSGTTTITQALFNNNAATSGIDVTAMGGALFNDGTATISESTFVGNTTNGSGGAIEDDFYYSNLTLNDDTITQNSASGIGSGLDIESGAPTTINNTIIAGNTAIPGAVNSDCNACTGGAGNLIGVTVNLGPLALNGGPTETMMPLPGSSAISAGDPTAAAGEDIDQRGFSRFNANGSLDVGAVQSHYTSVAFAAQPSNTVVNATITPSVAVQVVETDPGTSATNYPMGVPVTLTLLDSQSNPVTGALAGTLTQSPTNNGGVIEAVFPDLSVNTTGTYELFATDAISGNSSSANPAYSATSNTFQILVPVTLSWQPAPLTYGPMPQSELNAVATVNGSPGVGTYVYTFVGSGATINVGQIYPVGTYQVQVAFTPAGTTSTYTLQTAMQITQAKPVLTWPTPAAIYTSTPLGSAQLDATVAGVTGAALPGTFVYSPAAGTKLTAGQQVLSTTFTPTDTTDYTTATGSVTIQVNAVAAGTVTIQDSANPITFGQSETFTAAVTGTDGQPFSGGTASFTVDGAAIGSAQIVNGSGAVSDTALTGGTHQVGVSYSSTPSSQPLTASTTITVNKATPALTWPTPAAIYTSTPLSGTQLDATATGVGGTALAGSFVYNPAAGATLPAGLQTLSTTFTPTDTTDYNSNTAQVTIQVNAPTAGTIAIQESANPITFGQSETFTVAVTGTDGKPLSGGTATFTVDGTGIGSAAVVNGSGSVSDATLTGGTHQVGVSYTNTTTNQTLTATTTITVNKATPVLTWATPAAIYTSTPLSATQLNASAAGVTGAALAGTFVYTPPAGTMLPAGAHALATTFTPTDTTDYNSNTAQVTIQVNAPTAGTVAIQESANPITFGQSETFTVAVTGTDGKPLSGGTATFTVDGTGIGSAAVVNGSGSVSDAALTAGTHQVGVSYTNTTTNQTLTAAATLTVNKATPVLAWATPAAIYTSTALSATQLDASATGVKGTALPGTFVYNPAAGTTLTAGSHVLATTFTPTDTTDYNTNTAQVTIQVNAPTAGTVAIQESANPITYGQSETFTVAVTGSDGKPLSGGTATFSVDGTGIGSAAVVNGSGSVSDATLTAGSHQVGVSYTNTTTNQTLTATATLTVNKATPVLAWATPAAIYTSTPLSATQLNATATGVTGTALPGTFAYNPAAGTTLTAGAHVLATTFTPTDSTDYNTNTAQVTIQVNTPTAGTVAIQESANPITYGQSETFTVAVTGSDGKPLSGGTATFSVDGTGIGSAAVVNGSGSVSDATLTAGSHQVGVSYTNTTTNQTLTATATLTVNKATPVLKWATPAAIYTSTPLSATQLNATATGVAGTALAGTFVYNPAAGTTLAAGAHLLAATFTPTDTTDYNTNTAQVTIQVNAPTAGTIAIQESANPITYGQSETFTVAVTGSDGKPLSGGTATISVDGTGIGSASVVNGSGSVTDTSLTAGSHQVGVSYTNTTTNQTLTASATLTVNKATPVLKWATPAAIYTSTPLSATQLNASAAGVTGAPLAGTFVYSPAAGTTLAAGPHVLAATFTPTDTTDYTTNTAQVTVQVNTPTAATVIIQESANPITFGKSETLTATVTGSDGQPSTGGTASFTSDGTAIGSAPVANGSASISISSLTAGVHQIAVSYTNSTLSAPLTGSAALTVNKAAPVLAWATPATIFTVMPLSSTQLDATASGVNGAALPGTFVYSPAAGTLLTQGAQTLSTTFTPTDTTNYTTATAQVIIQVGYSTISIAAVSPGTAQLGTTPLPITITGSGFTATAVVEINGTAVATKVQNSTTLTAAIPAADLVKAGTLSITVYDSVSKFSSNVVQFAITAPAANFTLSITPTTASGEQPTIDMGLNSPYPLDLQGTLTLTFSPSGNNSVDDPAIQFSTGGRTFTFTVPAGTTTTPQVALQTGTVAGTITVTLTLTAGGVDVTPQGLAPITLVIAASAPVITSVTFTSNNQGLITVVVSGFSNTRDASQAEFVFTGKDASHLHSSKVDVPVTGLFGPWYSSSDSDQYGSEFTYTQNFQLSKPDSGITGVSVTLTNSAGTSGSVNSQ